MDSHNLDEFRRRWQEELAQAQAVRKRRRPEAAERRPRRPEVFPGRGEQASGYLALAQGLLEGAGRPPAALVTRTERQDAASRSRSPPARGGAGGGEQLVDQLIRDLVSDRRLLLRPGPAPGTDPPVSWNVTVCRQYGGRKASRERYTHLWLCMHSVPLEAQAPKRGGGGDFVPRFGSVCRHFRMPQLGGGGCVAAGRGPGCLRTSYAEEV